MKNIEYNLASDSWGNEEVSAINEVIKSNRYTMGPKVKKFEKEFASYFNSEYAIMVNSGSSANLLSVFASCNPLRKNRFKPGDEAIIQGLCWSTSLWPLVQAGLKPKFVDVEKNTLNVDPEKLISAISKKTAFRKAQSTYK